MAKHPGGRPVKDIKPAQIETLMRFKPSLEDTAAYFECSARTIERYIRDNYSLSFVEFRDQKMVHTRLELVQTALSKASSGNIVMLIFCLKNLCGWKDRYEQENTGSIDLSAKVIAPDGKILDLSVTRGTGEGNK